MMNNMNKLNELVCKRAMQTMGHATPNDCANYMWGYYRGLLNHLERTIPAVAQELAVENYCLMQEEASDGQHDVQPI